MIYFMLYLQLTNRKCKFTGLLWSGRFRVFLLPEIFLVSVKMLESNLRHGYNRTKEGLSAGGMAVNPKINWFIEAANSC